ncbi:MAG: hypothetical protein IPP94_01115 [Ignavibacteria bacterium]|nr:hypothetical protein [Ignavibacteria bacterium]
MTSNLASNRALRVTARILQCLVAGAFLLAAVKALDISAFAAEIRGYGIFPELSLFGAWFFVIVEVMLAMALLVNAYPRMTALAMLVLLAVFVAVTAYALSIGLQGSCGCFGNLVHRTPQQVIVEDVLMMCAMLFVLLVHSKQRMKTAAWKPVLILLSGAAAAGLAIAAPHLPLDSYVTDLRVGKQFSSWPVEGLTRDLQSGTHFVFLFTSTSKTIETDVAMMNAVAQSEDIPSTIGLLTEGTAKVTEVMFQYGTAFPVGALEPKFARYLYRTLPRAFILRDGEVREVWSRIPTPAEAQQAMRAVNARSTSP